MAGWELELLEKYCHGEALSVIAEHGRVVADLALEVGRGMGLSGNDCRFVEEAALLHDIGISRICMPKIGLITGSPYIMHGILGREILESEGLPLHALVCERHIGVGLTVEDIVSQQLPLPQRDMSPKSICEQIVCYADLFYSKTPGRISRRKTPEQVRAKLAGFGSKKVEIFDCWLELFGTVTDR